MFLKFFATSTNKEFDLQYVKGDRILSYSGPYFFIFGLNPVRYSVQFRIQSKCGKIRTRITQNMDTFYAVMSGSPFFLFQQIEKWEQYILTKAKALNQLEGFHKNTKY